MAEPDLSSDAVRIENLRSQAAAYEHGNGVLRDGLRATNLYCDAARLGDAASAYDLGWMYANGRGVKRDDALAAAFLQIAADRGIEQAKNLLRVLDAPGTDIPECLRVVVVEPPEPVEVAAPEAPPIATLVSEAAEAPKRAPAAVVEIVRQIAPEYGVPIPLVWAIMETESNFNSAAVSPKNAQGLMQLMPDTAARFLVKNSFDPAQNIRGGVAYLRWLLAYFEGNVSWVAAAYNAGEGAVERHGGVPPYAETRAYVRRIIAAIGEDARPFDSSIVKPSPHLGRLRDSGR